MGFVSKDFVLTIRNKNCSLIKSQGQSDNFYEKTISDTQKLDLVRSFVAFINTVKLELGSLRLYVISDF